MLLRRRPPTLKGAGVICPSKHSRTALTSTTNTLSMSINARSGHFNCDCFSSSVKRIRYSFTGIWSPLGLRKMVTPMIGYIT